MEMKRRVRLQRIIKEALDVRDLPQEASLFDDVCDVIELMEDSYQALDAEEHIIKALNRYLDEVAAERNR